jgi:2-phospho-L-lactate guanylyltransferase
VRESVGWTVVLPLKGGPGAKSRLGATSALATAIALDSLAAVRACADVAATLVVTADDALAARVRADGCQVVPERSTGLSGAVQEGLAAAHRLRPGQPVAVLLGDVPAVRPQDLAAALAAAHDALSLGSVFVPDADGTGTVLLAAARPAALRAAFGPGSAAAHAQAGIRRLDLDLPRLRRDVDTPADLAAAVELGVGPRTRAVLRQAEAWLPQR